METKERPFMKQWRELKAKHPDALLLFRCGDFYEAYDEDAVECAKVLGITLTYRNGDRQQPMAGFPHHALDTYLPRLVRTGHRLAICDQLEDPKLTKKLVKRGITEQVYSATNENESKTKSETTMATNAKAADLIGKVIVVNGSDVKYVIKSVDGDKLMTDFIMGDRTMPCPIPMSQVDSMVEAGKWTIEDATANANDNANENENHATAEDVEEVEDIKVEEPKAATVKMEPKDKAEEPKGQKVNHGGSKPKTTKGKQETKGHKLTYSTYMNGTKEQGRISGFAETDAAYLAGRDFHGSAYPVKGVLCLSFGKAYKDFARQLCDALNAGKTVDECKAMLEKYDAERAQKKAEWRAKREARNANANESEKAGGKTYTEAEVADLLKRVMEGDAEAMRIVNAMQKAA